jgi:hypothetical protein
MVAYGVAGGGRPYSFTLHYDRIWRYGCLDDYIEYYNTDRLHWALDINNYETPMMAFRNKAATGDVGRQYPKWMEAGIIG